MQWLGSLKNIQTQLVKQGWQSYPATFNLREMLRRFTLHITSHKSPVIRQLYNNQSEALLMTKNLGHNRPTLILRLWDSDIVLQNVTQHLWLGVVDYYQNQKMLAQLKIHKNKKFISATKELIPDLKDFNWRIVTYPPAKQPPEMRHLDWDGKVLIIEVKKQFLK